ncbi:unnamed protein product [Chironomus riparius]|uniref:IMD domain-containing protein n=1 Tax=Chironomus riparius TaxID=315576 RepID=A0A9P0J0F0_9DIPT|nr:unnamed protein product [Chironomus riparius]
MDISIEKVADITLGSLFQQIINDMKNSSPLWEDFIIKATKLHACLRAAIQAISTYLEAFQKIADAATNSKGASKEIGTALTRVCLRHKAVETRLKTFTTAIMDSLIIPLQDKLEEWKRQVVILDKDHTKEYKRCRNELKKRSSDTLRLQKKAKKGTTDLQSLVDSSMQTVNQQKAELDEVERKSLRIAMIEDRTRYCQFVHMLEPVVKQEYEMMYELGHLQEAMMTVTNVTKDPSALPQASEELIAESKTSYNLYPESPTHSSSQGCSNSLGSRKSSVCSISSMNSSGSSGSPSHQFQRSLSQYNPTIRLKPGESTDSRDSGFCSSSPALTIQASTATSQSHAISTWPPPTQESVSNTDRPHTISTAYERGHQRPALTVYTFQNPDQNISENSGNSTSQKSPANISCRPPLPIRCSSLERPLSTTTNTKNTSTNNVNARQCPSPIPAHVAKVETLDVIDTIELDNLIGELDMFQREHEEKEKKRLERQQSNEYQVPKNSIVQTQKTHHNDSFISTSTTITGTFSHAFSNNNNSDECSEKSTDKVSLNASLNYSITSNTSMMTNATLSDVQKTFNSSENCWNDNNNDDDLSADTGFENPSFRHLNDTNIVLMRDDDLPPNYYSQNATDVVVLRSKSNSMGSNNNSITDLHTIDMTNEQKQRLSSFKLDNNNLSLASSNGQGSPSHYFSINNSNSINNNNPIPNVNKASLHKSFGALMYGQTEEPITSNNVNVNNNVNVVTSSNKPAVTPRPASLLSGVSRIARRSSVNTVKPPPPVRRSSSATPNHYSDANNSHNNQLQNQQQFNSSSEALPPPPDYLLRSQQQAAAQQQQNALHHHQNAQQQQQQQQHHYSHHAEHNANAKTHYMTSSTSVGQISSQLSTQNVRTVNDLRNAPNSPGVMRRQLSLSNHHPSSNHSQSSHSITYSSQPSTPKIEKEGSGSMFSIYGLTTGSGNANGTTYSSGDIFGTMPRQTKSQQGVYAQPKQVSGISSFRNSSPNPPPQKQSMGLLASLTAKIAPNKSHNQQQQQQQQQNQQQQQQQQQSDYDRSRNEPIYQRRSSNQSNQYYDTAQQQQQQQQPNYGDRQSDGKNQIYSQSSNHQYQHQYSIYNQNIYVSTNPFITPPINNYSPSSFGKDNYSNYQTGNYGDKTDSVLAKANPNFLDNLNAKLAEQHATNKALAVRSFINSKVVRNGSQIPCNIKYVANRIVEEPEPDPRIVRESLMDQIKRGANLKQTPR